MGGEGRDGPQGRWWQREGLACGTGEGVKDSPVEGQGQQLLSRCLPPASQQLAFSANMCCWGQPVSSQAPSQRQLVPTAGPAAFSLAKALAICWLTGAGVGGGGCL